MREICKGGAVVAAVVAVLERQQSNYNNQQLSTRDTINSTQKESSVQCLRYNQNSDSTTSNRKSVSNSLNAKNNYCLDDQICADENFQSAVKDFDNVAEDVEKIVAASSNSNSLKTSSKNGFKTDPQSSFALYNNSQRTIERCGNYVKHDERNFSARTDNGDEYSSDSSEDSDSSSSSDNDNGQKHVIENGLATIAEEERSTTQSYKGIYRKDVRISLYIIIKCMKTVLLKVCSRN